MRRKPVVITLLIVLSVPIVLGASKLIDRYNDADVRSEYTASGDEAREQKDRAQQVVRQAAFTPVTQASQSVSERARFVSLANRVRTDIFNSPDAHDNDPHAASIENNLDAIGPDPNYEFEVMTKLRAYAHAHTRDMFLVGMASAFVKETMNVCCRGADEDTITGHAKATRVYRQAVDKEAACDQYIEHQLMNGAEYKPNNACDPTQLAVEAETTDEVQDMLVGTVDITKHDYWTK